jgi:hypothetical protein
MPLLAPVTTTTLSISGIITCIGFFLFSQQRSAEHHAIVKDIVSCLSIG